jgi:tetratricopeptide (TPR) repeat protein
MIQSIVPPKSNALVFLWPCLALTAVQKQPNLTFQTNFLSAVNHWVVLPKNGSEQHYLYGYLYFDRAKGIVFCLENTLTFDGSWKLNRAPKSYVLQKTMQDPSMKVALLPKSIQRAFHLPEKPAALGAIPSPKSADYASQLGYYLNQIEQSSLAVPLLKKALKKNPTHAELLFELGYAYNAMARYTKAIEILERLAKIAPSQKGWQELGYAYLETKKPTQAEHCYFEAFKSCQNKAEIQKIGYEMQAVFIKMGAFSLANKWEKIAKTGKITAQ